MPKEPEQQRRITQQILRASAGTRVDELLFDSVTSLPGLPLLARKVGEVLQDRETAGILTLNIAQFSRLEDVYGWEAFDEIVRGFAECLKNIKDDSLRQDDMLAELTLNGNVFILMLSPPRNARNLKFRDLIAIKERIAQRLNAHVRDTLNPELLHRVTFFIGCAMMHREKSVRIERLLYRTIDEALADATTEQQKLVRRRSRKLREILDGRRITTMFQPILDLRDRRIIGYEALSRGPAGEFAHPDILFRTAYEADLVLKLDSVCRERALRGSSSMAPDQLLFVNMEPLSVFDPGLIESVPAKRASRVVFEITEHAAIADFATFRQAVQFLKRAGFKIAMDDVGSAYSGLRVIAEIEPDFIKLDMELTRDSHRNHVKMELLKTIARFCGETNLPLIAEGVESAEELEAVTSLGISLVQGYLLGRPSRLSRQVAPIWPEFPATA